MSKLYALSVIRYMKKEQKKEKPGLCVIPASVGAIQVVSTLMNNPFQTNLFADFVNLICEQVGMLYYLLLCFI